MAKKLNPAIVISGNIMIGYKFIGPFSDMGKAMKFCDAIRKNQDSEISHAELMMISLYSEAETMREVKERGHLMSQKWACIPRR